MKFLQSAYSIFFLFTPNFSWSDASSEKRLLSLCRKKFHVLLICFAQTFLLQAQQQSIASCYFQQQDSILTFRNAVHQTILSINANNFLSAHSFNERVKTTYGSFEFKQSNRVNFTQIQSLNIQQFQNSFFLTGNVGNEKNSFPFEVGIFLNDTFLKRYWLSVKLIDSNLQLASIAFTLNTESKHFYGFGEQFSILDFAGKRINILTEENGIGRSDLPVSKLTKMVGVAGTETSSYLPLPKFFTETGYAFSVKPSNAAFDFTQPNKIIIEVPACSSSGKCLFNITADTSSEMMKSVMQTLPDWAYGTILGLQGGVQRVEEITDKILASKNPVTAVWIQDWVGRRKVNFGSRLWWRWQADETHYPDLKTFIQKMNQKGLKVLGYINPFIIAESNWFDVAVANSYLVKKANGKNYKIKAGGFDAYMIDLSNPSACNWFKEIIKSQMIDVGFSGWMADFAEWLPMDAKLHNGFSGKDFHNFYPVAWARINREAAQERGVDDSLVIFHRSGSEGSQQYVKMFWTGDQTTDFGLHDGFPSAVKALLSSSASGLLYNHSDIGGYTNIDFGNVHIKRSRELLYRWIEFATFTPFFRTHEGLKPDKNIQAYSDAATISFFSKFGQLHYALKDYMKAAVADASPSMQSLIRPLYFQKDFEQHEYEFLLGEDLLIAPVVQHKQEKIEVLFPAGKWKYAWNADVVFDKGKSLVDVPLGKPAVFIRQGGKWESTLTKIFEAFQ